MSDNAGMICLMGYSLAKDHDHIKKGIELCIKAIQINPANADNYLYLGRLYLMVGKRELAIKTFRAGLKIRRDNRVVNELVKLGIRKPPPFNLLPRDHKLNILVGKLLKLIRLR